MPVPLFAVLSQVAVRVVTSPQIWQVLGIAAVVTFGGSFVLETFFEEVVATISALWWVVGLIVILLISRIALPIYIQERAKTQRAQLGKKCHDDE
ncbi:hypothetical protein RV134_270360 [Roseovarius sp. EC-HK134]|uniref:hypothetical protein n=1 Tax=unclassified Roseovarius TaxID=2614913 RepID=UPI001251524A|nr:MULTISPECIES: hypothetical protein [unclassified Roseovarius]VVT16226.1 hypothetical protein RV134_270360 [Roseovarius sp. EC-HK134]VVT16838.1 hypothetical protein RV420_330087 [Roseovarius sp. EC-SD190]